MRPKKGYVPGVAMIPFTFKNSGSDSLQDGVFSSLETLQGASRERRSKTRGINAHPLSDLKERHENADNQIRKCCECNTKDEAQQTE